MDVAHEGSNLLLVTIIPDFREEGWHSMDLNSDMLIANHSGTFRFQVAQPKFSKVFGRLPIKFFRNIDRFYNRFVSYPSYLKKMDTKSGFFHLVDHSYSHLLHYLPGERTGVYCHDLDAFRCILEPSEEKRPAWFVKMTRHIFSGFLKARVVFCNSQITRENILRLNHWKFEDVHLVPPGICDEFVADGPAESGEYLLHVGSCIPRKRIDVLLNVFGKVSQRYPSLKLIQAGGTFTKVQENQIYYLGIRDKVEQRKGLSREDLAKLYRGAKCLLITSDSEGFGLPSIEAIKCGCPVISNSLPSVEEAVGNCARYASNQDLDKWVFEINSQLGVGAENEVVIPEHIDHFTWASYAAKISNVYRGL